MSLVGSFDKSGVERLDYEIDLANVLAGERVTKVVWTSSAPAELPTSDPTVSGTKVRVWLAGGVPGKFYTVTAAVTTSAGRTFSRGFGVRMVDAHADEGATQLSRTGVGGDGTGLAVAPQWNWGLFIAAVTVSTLATVLLTWWLTRGRK